MKTYDQLIEDAGEKFANMNSRQFADYQKANPGGADKAAQLRKSAQNKKTPSTTSTQPSSQKQISGQKGLPGSKGGALATRPADKGSEMVRSKQSKTSGGAIVPHRHKGAPDEKQSGQRPGTTRTKTKTRGSSNLGKFAKGVGGAAVGAAKAVGKAVSGPGPDAPETREGQKFDGGSQYISRTKRG